MESHAIRRGKDSYLIYMNLNPLLVSMPCVYICHDGSGQFLIRNVAELDVLLYDIVVQSYTYNFELYYPTFAYA